MDQDSDSDEDTGGVGGLVDYGDSESEEEGAAPITSGKEAEAAVSGGHGHSMSSTTATATTAAMSTSENNNGGGSGRTESVRTGSSPSSLENQSIARTTASQYTYEQEGNQTSQGSLLAESTESYSTGESSYRSMLSDSMAANHPEEASTNGETQSGYGGGVSFFQQVTNGASSSAPSRSTEMQHGSEMGPRRKLNAEEAKRIVDSVMPPEPNPNDADEFVVKRFAEYMKYSEEGHNFTENLRSKKEFQNPYILDRVAEHFGLDGENEYASNYPTDLFDPQAHGPEDYYDSISYRQQIQEEFRETRRQMEPRSTVSFVPPSSEASAAGETSQTNARPTGSTVDQSSVQAATAKARAVAADLMRKQQKQGQR